MKRLLALILLLAATPASAEIRHIGTTGQTLYARVQTGASTYVAVALAEGSSGGLGNYTVSDADLVTAGVNSASTGNGFVYTVRSGAPSTTAGDTIVAGGMLPWSGSVEMPLPANATQWAGAATASDDIALLAQLASSNFADSFLTAAKIATDAIGAAEVAADAATEIGAAIGGTVSAVLVDDDDTWTFDSPTQITSPKILVESKSAAIMKSFDFSEPITGDGSLASITSVTVADVSGATEPTITSSTLSLNKKKVNVLFAASSATAATYTVTATVLTTDSQTPIRKGRLTIE